MFKNFKSKILAMVTIILAFSIMFSVPVSAIEWSGSTGGGGAGHNTSSTRGDYSVEWVTDNAVGYRFTRVDYDGKPKSGCIDVLASSFTNGFNKAQSAQWMSTKMTKIQLKKSMYSGSFSTTAFQNAGAVSDADVFGGSVMPSNPKEIEGFVKNKYYLDLLCKKYFGLNGGHQDFGNGEKVLVEPLFYARLDGTYCVMTISEIGVWGGWKFGWDQPTTTVDDANYYGYIAYYLNKYWAGLLYNESTDFWYAGYDPSVTRGAYNNNNSQVVSFRYLVEAGFGVGYAYNDTTPPETTKPVDLYCWGVEWYSDAGYKNFVAESTLNANNAGERLVEGRTYYPVYVFKNNSNTTVQANVYKDEPCLLFKNS